MSLIIYLSVEQREEYLSLFILYKVQICQIQTSLQKVQFTIQKCDIPLYFWHLIKLLRLLVAYYYWLLLKAQ